MITLDVAYESDHHNIVFTLKKHGDIVHHTVQYITTETII